MGLHKNFRFGFIFGKKKLSGIEVIKRTRISGFTLILKYFYISEIYLMLINIVYLLGQVHDLLSELKNVYKIVFW